MIDVRLPSFGADMEDAEFVQWKVAPGQAVVQGDVVCVVETQKGAIDVEAWQPGVVARLIAEPGQRLPVGAMLAVLAGEGESWQAIAAAATASGSAAAPGAPGLAPGPEAAMPSGLRASPAARKRARELGVDLSGVKATGSSGAISLSDVERSACATPDPGAAMRGAIAAAMSHAKREIPHYYLGREIDVETAHRWLEAFNAQRPVAGRVLFAALMLKAIGVALREVPELNGRYQQGRFEPSARMHLGMVTSLRGGGLVVPTVHDADRLALPALMQALDQVLTRARRGQLRSSDLADSTLTVTNLGELGCDLVYGVIYPPQVALVGLGRVAERPIVRDGHIAIARTLQATLSADHRVSDGMRGARFLVRLQELLQEPEQLE